MHDPTLSHASLIWWLVGLLFEDQSKVCVVSRLLFDLRLGEVTRRI